MININIITNVLIALLLLLSFLLLAYYCYW